MDEISEGRSPRLNRKQFLQGLLALGGAAVIHPSLAALDRAYAQDAAGEPVRGGTLRVNMSGDPAHFDPLSGGSVTQMNVVGPCYNGLARYDPNDPYAIIPDLAKEWEISDDGLTYTFHLVDGVEFHDGKPMTSADVKYTFDVIRDPPEGTASARQPLFAVVDSIEAVDDLTVKFVLKRPSPSFIHSIANAWSLILPKHILEVKGDMKVDVVGTGPFKFVAYNRGSSIELVRNENYHVPDRPYLDAVTIFIIPDLTTTWSYLETGQIDWFTSIQGQDAGVRQTGENVLVQSCPSTSFICTVFNARVAPFDDVRVRKALSLAIDRNVALKITYNGQGELGGLSVPGPWALPPERLHMIEGYGPEGTADLDRAKELLAEAGHADGFDVKMLVRKNPLFEPVGILLKDQWAKVGVNVTLEIEENATYVERSKANDFQVIASGGSYALIEPDSMFSEYLCNSEENNSGVCEPTYDERFELQSSTMDPEKRKELVHELEQEMLSTYGIYVMYWRNRFMGTSKKMNGMLIHPNIDQNMRLDGVWLSA